MSKFEIKGVSFYILSKRTAILKGNINQSDLNKLKSWVRKVKNDAVQDAVLILDCAGGKSDPTLLMDIMQVPIHMHVCRRALSMAALIFLCGSAKTMSPDSSFMLHDPRWKALKDSKDLDPDILFRHRLKIASIVSTIAPGKAKTEMVRAVSESSDVFFTQDFMWHTCVVDAIMDYTGEALGLEGDDALWYNNMYGKQDKDQ